jgi:hypothetical protein
LQPFCYWLQVPGTFEDLTHDSEVGFKLLTTEDIDELKPSGIIKAIKEIPAWIEDVLEMRPSVAAFQKKEPWVCRSKGQLQPARLGGRLQAVDD